MKTEKIIEGFDILSFNSNVADNMVVRLSTGGQIDTSLTGEKIYSGIQKPANWL